MGFLNFLKGGGGGIISSVLGGGMGLIGSAINAKQQKEMQERSFDYEPGSFQDYNSRFLRAVDYVFGLPFRNIK